MSDKIKKFKDHQLMESCGGGFSSCGGHTGGNRDFSYEKVEKRNRRIKDILTTECKNCGEKLKGTEKFCPECGKKA